MLAEILIILFVALMFIFPQILVALIAAIYVNKKPLPRRHRKRFFDCTEMMIL